MEDSLLDEPPQKRFKYASYNERINGITIDAGKSKGVSWEKEEFDEDEQTKTPFSIELARLSLLDLTLPFQDLHRALTPLTTSLPITLHNQRPLFTIFFDFYDLLKPGEDHLDSGLSSAVQLHQALFETCLGEGAAHVPQTVHHLLRIGALKALDPDLVERTYSTLSLVLRLLAPSLLKVDPSSTALLRSTWSEIRPYLRRKENKKYVRKCVADAWAGVVRKVRNEGLQRLLDVMLEGGEQEGLEAIWVNSLKGSSGQLHSRAMDLLRSLLDRACVTPTELQTRMLELTLTAVIHHSSTASLKPVVEAVLDRLEPSPPAEPSTSVNASITPYAASTAMLRLLSTLLFVRKGKRFPEPLIKPTMQKLLTLIASIKNNSADMSEMPDNVKDEGMRRWRQKVTECVAGCLVTGKLAHWLSPGVTLIDRLWEGLGISERFAFADVLLTLQWPGTEQFLLPHITRTALTALSSDALHTLGLLNHLAAAGYLDSGLYNAQGGRWRQGLILALKNLFNCLTTSGLHDEVNRRLFGQLLLLLQALPSEADHFAPIIVQEISQMISSASSKSVEDLESQWQTVGPWNDSHLLGSMMSCVVHLVKNSTTTSIVGDLTSQGILQSVLARWSWNREVVGSVAELTDCAPAIINLSNETVARLAANIMSSDALLRRSTLRILSAHEADPVDAPIREIWAASLNIEQSQMTLKNVRDRTANIARLGRLLASLPHTMNDSTREIAQIAVRYLITQFKINFRPLYNETIKALHSLESLFAQYIYQVTWEELQRVYAATSPAISDFGIESPAWSQSPHRREIQGGTNDTQEDEFVCRSLNRSRMVCLDAWSNTGDLSLLDPREVSVQISPDRLDVLNYESQLLALLAAIPSLTEKHSRDLVPAFFAVTGQEDSQAGESSRMALSRHQHQQRTASYLELFAKFANPKAAFRADELRAVYLNILSKGESKLQSLALRCLMTFKSPKLLPYEENLKALLDETKFRDELTHFALNVNGDSIREVDRNEVIPVVIRILYGVITSKRGRGSSAQGPATRKAAALNALSGCTTEELGALVERMLEHVEGPLAERSELAPRQQLGFLTFLADVIRFLGPQTVLYWSRLIEATIGLVGMVQERLSRLDMIPDEQEDSEMPDEVDLEDDALGSLNLARSIRTLGVKRLVQFLRAPVSFDFTPFLPTIFESIIIPRLDKLSIENTQAPSATLELIAALAASPETSISLVQVDLRTLPRTFACMTAVKVKPAVIARVFDVVESLLGDESNVDLESSSLQQVLGPNMRALIGSFIGLVESKAAGEENTRRLLSILSRLSSITTDGEQAQQLATLLGPMLRQSNRQLPEKAKLNILNTLQRLYKISPEFADPNSLFFSRSYDVICNLFQTLFFPSSRRALVEVLRTFGHVDTHLDHAITLVAGMNAYSARRMDEPDFEKRLAAFDIINEGPESQLPTSSREWPPILRSALFFLHEPDELSIRSNASAVLQRFITHISIPADSTAGTLTEMLLHVVMPGVRAALRSKHEPVRNEALLVVSHAVKTSPEIPIFAEMQPLLGEDEETNVFANISHIQVHRRSRALRRLREICAEGHIQKTTISTIFLPVVEHIIAGSTENKDHHYINEAVTTIGALAACFSWAKYNNLIKRNLRLGSVKGSQQRLYIRAISSIIDNFHFDLSASAVVEDVNEAAAADDEEDPANEKDDMPEAPTLDHSRTEHITQLVLTRLLPALSKFVASRDEAEDSVRIPLALATVKLAQTLPEDVAANEITRIINIVSQILRSRDQEIRDIARDTIGKIAVFLGPDWLSRVLNELRTALQRGPQKHVLAVTTHSILNLATTEASQRFADLDNAVDEALQIALEVVWGESGADAESEDYKTKMREVRGARSRGFDTFQLVARLVSPARIGAVMTPVREVMHASQSVKAMQSVDETLRRIALGLNANTLLMPQDLLALCFSLISGNSAYVKPKKRAPKGSKAPDAFRVQMQRDEKGEDNFYALNAHKLVAFGLDLFVTAFRRGKFDFDNLDILARLGPLVDAVVTLLTSTKSSVVLLALKASAAIARCPVPQVDTALPIMTTSIFRIIKQAGGSAESEIAQTALKTLAVILRDCKATQLSEKQLHYLLEIIGPDVEEPERQSAIFTMLRSIVGRKLVVPEIYDLMDRISSIMVTSQSTHVQELCRGLLIQFLLDYPQGKGRLRNQMVFLVKNLDYVYESGRISVLELLSAVLQKFSEGVIAEYAEMIFVALVKVLADDESTKCRTMSGLVIRFLFRRLEDDQMTKFTDILKTWVDMRRDNVAIAHAAMAVFVLVAETGPISANFATLLLQVINPIIEESADVLEEGETGDENLFDGLNLDHSLPHQALMAASRLLRSSPGSASRLDWKTIVPHLLFPHDWVRFAAARVLATFVASSGDEAFDLLGNDLMFDIAKKSCLLLKGGRSANGRVDVVDNKVADEVVKVLWNVVKRWAVVEQPADRQELSIDNDPKKDDVEERGDDADIEGETTIATTSQPLHWLMSRMSFIARHLIVHRPTFHQASLNHSHWTAPIMSILRFFAGSFESFPTVQAKLFSMHVLSPIYRILDEGGDLREGSDDTSVVELRELAIEVRDFVQTKIGTTDFSHVWDRLRSHATEKREGRREARNRMAVTNPQTWADRKSRKGVIKKDSKKRKSRAFAESRHGGRAVKRRG